jgi:hypothetical protein
MNEDKILEMFFEKARWQYAIEKGLFKDMNKAVMYQLTTPKARLTMYQRIKSGNYKIMPPHTAKIPKDNGDYRTVYVNESVDRILLSIANDLLFELMPDMVHPRCTSYQKGIGCGRVVQDVSRIIYSAEGKIIGWKGDFSKYFDSVPIRFIDWAFDKVEEKFGKSALIDVIRDYYHTDIYFDEDNNLCEKYQSLKQGCSVAAWLADVILYHLDDKLSKLNGYYVRYSDDTLFVGEDYEKAMDIMKSELEMMQMTLNPKKVEYLDANHWFKFLGYSIKGHNISLSSTRIKTFQKEIETRTERRQRHSSIPAKVTLTYVFRTRISSLPILRRRYMPLSAASRARCMTATPTRKSTMPFTSSIRPVSIWHGTLSSLTHSSVPTKVLVLITPCATSSCSTEQDSRRAAERCQKLTR